MDKSGYVYLAKFETFKDCYKIGSTSNPDKRRKCLESTCGPTDFIAAVKVSDKVKVERQIQRVLYRCSNKSVLSGLDLRSISLEDLAKVMPMGNFRSEEYFKFGECELRCAIELFKSYSRGEV